MGGCVLEFTEIHYMRGPVPSGMAVTLNGIETVQIRRDRDRLQGEEVGRVTLRPDSVKLDGMPANAAFNIAHLSAVYSRTHISLQGYLVGDVVGWCTASIPLKKDKLSAAKPLTRRRQAAKADS